MADTGDDYVSSNRELVLVDHLVKPLASRPISTSSSDLNDTKATEDTVTDRGKSFKHIYQRNHRRAQDSKASPTNMPSASEFTLPKVRSARKVPRRSGGPSDKASPTNTPSASKFTLPKGRSARKVPRRSRGSSDKASPKNTPSASKFTLPKGWSVRKVPRRSGGHRPDKYYHEPGTGRQFRSLKEVERYVSGKSSPPLRSNVKRLTYHHDENVEGDITEEVTPRPTRVKRLKYGHDEKVEGDITEEVTPRPTRVKRLKYRHDEKNSDSKDLIVAGGEILDMEEDKDNQYQLANVSPTSVVPGSTYGLPDGWVVEQVPRRSGGFVDKYYYEPGGQKFRSMLAAQKFLLAEVEENSPLSVVLEEIKEKSLPLSKAFKINNSKKKRGSYNSPKESISKKEKASSPKENISNKEETSSPKENISNKEETSSSSFGSPPRKIKWVIGGNGGDAWNAFDDETLVPDSVKQHWGNTFMMAINNTKHTAPVSA